VGLNGFFRWSEAELLFEDEFLRSVHPLLPRLTPQRRELVLRTLEAAPKNARQR
jgi:hypothetical protein